MSYQLISLVFYNLILLFLLFVWIKTKGWQLNGTLYILFFLLFSGIISAFYWNVSNGTIRNYSNLTLIPFFYLIIGYLITLLEDFFCFFQFGVAVSIEVVWLDQQVTFFSFGESIGTEHKVEGAHGNAYDIHFIVLRHDGTYVNG